jgi:hypothetical protein
VSWDALDLAVALHAAPGRVEEIRARPLPRGISNLLRVALGQQAVLDEASRIATCDRQSLIEAARFFVEQQLLARECEADPWRVLGCRIGASDSEIRDHHHLLVRLVHPDRSDDWASAFAERVNRAWGQLRHAEGRSAALATRHVAAAAQRNSAAEQWRPPSSPAPRRAAAESEHIAPAAAARSRAPMFAAGALAGLALAALVWKFSAPAPAPMTVEAPAVSRPWYETPKIAAHVDAPAVVSAPEVEAMVPLALIEPKPGPARTNPITSPAPPPTTARVAAPIATRAPAALAAATVITPAAPALAEPVRMSTPEPVQALPEPAVAATTMASIDVPTDPTPTPPPARRHGAPSEAETVAVLARFSERYTEGNLGGLLALFARQVHAKNEQVAQLASKYSDVFGSTLTRQIAFSDLHWQRQGDRISGHGRYESLHERRGWRSRRTEYGRVEFELIRDGDTARLLRLEARAEGKS